MFSEEIFGSNRAMWFSTRGTKLAYAAFDESSVPLAYIPHYGIPDTMYDQYSTVFKYHYPKVLHTHIYIYINTLHIRWENDHYLLTKNRFLLTVKKTID